MSTSALLVMTQLPDLAAAQGLARALIEQRLAACVNIGTSTSSLYHWKGAVETAQEIPVTIKTTRAAYSRVEAVIRSLHPYELPEILAVAVQGGSPEYLEWVGTEIRTDDAPEGAP